MTPLSNSYLKKEDLLTPEPYYPLRAFVCEKCFLVQLPTIQTPEHIFKEYAYFSSYSTTWLAHCSNYVSEIIARFNIQQTQKIIEVASNDGHLLRNFQEKGYQILGIEPAENVANVAKASGIPTLTLFFGSLTAKTLAEQGHYADLLIANNVLAHVPDLNDFVAGIKIILGPSGIATLEFPWLLNLIQKNQFDTIYHEHFSYFSLAMIEQLFEKHQLEVFDAQHLETHGGSLRIYVRHQQAQSDSKTKRLLQIRNKELAFRLNDLTPYMKFQKKIEGVKRDLLERLIQIKKQGDSIVGYGAPAKGNTLLNYCAVGKDFLDYTVDKSSYKQGRFLPGTHISIYPTEKIRETKPNYLLILPWNFREEIINQMDYIRTWGGRFIVPIPKVEIIE